MEFVAIDVDESRNTKLNVGKESQDVLDVYPGFYKRVGHHPPWIGYFFRRDNEFVGCGGFKGKPKDGKVEIAYGTFKEFEGQRVGTEICRLLVNLSRQTDPAVRVTARTVEKTTGPSAS
jgi:ribosomal-protein-alanine N-acetyltransferase